MSGIVFQVDTTRILKILANDIYDSPLAMLRENLQNAYDAVRMRFARRGKLEDGGRIDIRIAGNQLSVSDNGVGMTEVGLRSNFWKAGSSGKHTEDARRSGVVGTFGIGAMANFGVCETLVVETRADGSSVVLRSTARRDALRIGEECIELAPVQSERAIGTTITATLDAEHPITVARALAYLEPYVCVLPVPVYLDDALISGAAPTTKLPTSGRTFSTLGSKQLNDNLCEGTFEVQVDANGQVLVHVTGITLAGAPIDGTMALLQAGGQLMGLRSRFGLAPVPSVGPFHFGGFADLSFLQPTAGREALNRESIEQTARLIRLAERAASELVAVTKWADKNNSLLEWILMHGRHDLADKVSVQCLPAGADMELGSVNEKTRGRVVHYYAGSDRHVLTTFANEQSTLLHVAQSNPRRQLQLQYLQRLGIAQVPDAAQITRIYAGSDLSLPEASVLLRIASVLRDDYLVVDIDVVFADISHGVTIFPQSTDGRLRLNISRASTFLPALVECYSKAHDVFGQFMKDFVRVSIYPNIQQYVPSSTREGVDALRKLLQRNRELFRYEETDRGDLEGLLGEYLRDNAKLSDVMHAARSAARPQTQRVSREQVGTVESVVPDVVQSPVVPIAEPGAEFIASPPILRDDVSSDLKILTTAEKHPQLNNFSMLLGLSDRLMQTEAEFFRSPHTTRILWGGHRVIYIFTEATGRLSLYYDIELRDPIDRAKTSGGMFPTTTLITRKRIFVPVPDAVAEEFRIESGSKEFFVRFDILNAESA
ncbi:MAG TPA: ATP-binding protein [Polyangiaceae bacterium]|nr:ATP-binding protein [Polyangiaceae bacterium]